MKAEKVGSDHTYDSTIATMDEVQFWCELLLEVLLNFIFLSLWKKRKAIPVLTARGCPKL